MRLVLEKEDLIRIIEKHFDTKLDSSMVQVRNDPVFELEVSGLPLAETSQDAPKTSAPKKNPEPPRETYTDGLSRGWTVTPPPEVPEPDGRVLGKNSTYDPPPPGYEMEGTPEYLKASTELLNQLGKIG